MYANDNAAKLINKLSWLIKNHEKLRNILKQNLEDKLELGLVTIIDPQSYDKSTQEEQIKQAQKIGNKQKNTQKLEQQEHELNYRKQSSYQVCIKLIIKKKYQIRNLQRSADFTNSTIQKDNIIDEANIPKGLKNIETEVNIRQDLQVTTKLEKNIQKRAQNQEPQKEVCKVCRKEFKSIITLLNHIEIAHAISFSQQELPSSKKQIKQQ
ncbi:hypothetical protein pb186bvf_011670 [Paramecium bursaria]